VTTTPPSSGQGPVDQPQAAFREMLRVQAQPIIKQVAAAERRVQEVLDPEADSSKSLPLALAQDWVCQWLIDALKTRSVTYVDAISCPDRRPIETVFFATIDRSWETISDRIREQPGYDNCNISPPRSFAEVQRVVKMLDKDFPVTKATFSNTLGPTLRSLERQQRPPGSMSEEDKQRFFQVLGLPADPRLWREQMVNADLASAIDALATAVANDHSVYLVRPGYAGRHVEPCWSAIASGTVLSRTVTLRLCEAERLYLARSVDRLVPTNSGFWNTHAAVRAALGDIRPRIDMPGLPESAMFEWLRDWHRLPESTGPSGSDERAPASTASRALPMPPQLGFEAMAQTWAIYHASRINLDVARDLCRALYDESDAAASCVEVTYDGLQLLAEALFNRLIAVNLPMAEVTMAASLLRKTGLPWLPPAGSSLALHRPAVAAYAVLSAAGMTPDDSTYWTATGATSA